MAFKRSAVRSRLSPPKRKTRRESCLSFWVSAAEGGLHPSELKCSGWQSHPSAEVLPAAKRSNAAKAARPRRAGGQDLRWLIQHLKYPNCRNFSHETDPRLWVRICFFGTLPALTSGRGGHFLFPAPYFGAGSCRPRRKFERLPLDSHFPSCHNTCVIIVIYTIISFYT